MLDMNVRVYDISEPKEAFQFVTFLLRAQELSMAARDHINNIVEAATPWTLSAQLEELENKANQEV